MMEGHEPLGRVSTEIWGTVSSSTVRSRSSQSQVLPADSGDGEKENGEEREGGHGGVGEVDVQYYRQQWNGRPSRRK